MVTSNADTKLKILLIGNGSIVAFAHSLSRLTLPNLITKQCPTLISSFSKSISFKKYILRSRMSLQRQHKKFEKLNAAFCESLKISILLPTVLNTAGESCFENVDNCFDDEHLSTFYRENFADCENFEELKEAFASIEVKHNARINITKFKLQLCTFVFQRLMEFPTDGSRFAESETLTALNLFEYVPRIINIKMHLHHFHINGKIHGYAQDFFNQPASLGKLTSTLDSVENF